MQEAVQISFQVPVRSEGHTGPAEMRSFCDLPEKENLSHCMNHSNQWHAISLSRDKTH